MRWSEEELRGPRGEELRREARSEEGLGGARGEELKKG